MSISEHALHDVGNELLVSLVRVADRLLGVEISAIREITRVGEITRVPDAPGTVRGVINLRGEVVTVIDLCARLGMGQATLTKASRLIIVQATNEHIALLVDGVEDVCGVVSEQREDLPANAHELDLNFFHCVYQLDRGLMAHLDIDAVLCD